MALPLSNLATWLTDQDVPGVGIDWMPDSPDEVVVVSNAGGLPPTLDGAVECQHVQIRCRAGIDPDAEALALQVHRLITGLTGSFTMGSTRIVTAEAVTGPPAFFGRDADQRFGYAAVYAFTTPT